MGRRRLNKKVALAGSAVLVLLGLVAVVVILSQSRGPAQFIEDGEAAWAAGDYESALRNYRRAYGRSELPEQRVEILSKLAELYRQTDDWLMVLGCWEEIVTADPQNLPARLGRLKYMYIVTNSLGEIGQMPSSNWQDIRTQATELLEMAGEAGILDEDKATWEPSFDEAEEPGWDGGITRLRVYLHAVKGRAAYELARMGAVTMPDELLAEAEAELTEALQSNPDSPDVYCLLADVLFQQSDAAEARGNMTERDAAAARAEDALAQGIANVGDRSEIPMYVLSRKLSPIHGSGIQAARQQIATLQPEWAALTQRFPLSAEVLAAVAEFRAISSAYLDSVTAADELGKAIEAIEKAMEIDAGNVRYMRFAARLHYWQFSRNGTSDALQRAIVLTEEALELPDAQDVSGPRYYGRIANRFSLCALLAECCVEQVLAMPESSPEREVLLAKIEQVVHEIEQIQGSGENPQVVKWQGMLDLARGDTGQAVRKLYAAHEQINVADASQGGDAFLSYRLAKTLENSAETGAVLEFLGSALSAGIVNSRPPVMLDYAEAVLKVGSYDMALRVIESYDERFGVIARSAALRVKALVAKGALTEAADALATRDPQNTETLELKVALAVAEIAQLRGAVYRDESASDSRVVLDSLAQQAAVASDVSGRGLNPELRDRYLRLADVLGQLLRSGGPMTDRYVIVLCEPLIANGDIEVVRRFLDTVLEAKSDSVAATFYRSLLWEPSPADCSDVRRRELQEQAIGGLPNPLDRSVRLGYFYQQTEQFDKAIAQWRQVLAATSAREASQQPAYLQDESTNPRAVAAGELFDIARRQEDWPLAEEMANLAETEDIDDCQGHLFTGRLAFARGQYDVALVDFEECLRQRPVFSYGYMLRGNVHAALGNEQASVEDVRRASALNPMDPLVARALANAFYIRNSRLANPLSSEQQLETETALERAVDLNPRDMMLLGVYADFIMDTEPLKALALRQTIYSSAPTVANALALGELATHIALDASDAEKKSAFFSLAERVFEDARAMEPANARVFQSYAEYYRARGQYDKAQELVAESQDNRLLWRHYFSMGRFDEARRILESLYAEAPDNVDTLKGLVLVTEETGDQRGVQVYSEALLAIEDNAINRLAQLRAYLNVGLVQEAQYKLQSFKERFPGEPRLLVLETLLAKRQGRLREALDLAVRNLEANQQDPVAWRLRGEIRQLMGNADEAIADFQRSHLLESTPATTILLARAYLWADRDDEAVRELRSVMDVPQVASEARTLLEGALKKLGRTEELRQLYTETLTKAPNSIYWLMRTAGFWADQGRYDQGTELYAQAYATAQKDASLSGGQTRDAQYVAVLDGYLRMLIYAAGESGSTGWQPERLEKVLEEGRKHEGTPYAGIALYRMAEAEKKLGDAKAAGEYCRRAIDAAWDDEQLAVEVLLRLDTLMSDVVADDCRQRLEANPNSLMANVAMFHLARARGDFADALGRIEKCIQISGSAEAAIGYVMQKADVLTVAYNQTSDNTYLEKAIGVYESLLAKMPTNSSVLNNLAYLLVQNDQRLPEALDYARKALERNPNDANYLDTYAFVLHKNGRDDEAAVALAAAIQQYEVRGTVPSDAYQHLGVVKEALGDKVGALAAYRRALEIGADTMPDAVRARIERAIEGLK